MIAALDTSGATAAFAVGSAEGEVLVRCSDLPIGRKSAGLLNSVLSALEDVALEVAMIRSWHVGMGPGSFTGIRMGAALVQGICAGTGAACTGVPSSLGLVRQGATAEAKTAASLHDGRRHELIVCEYCRADDDWAAAGEPRVISVDDTAALTVDSLIIRADDRAADGLPAALAGRLRVLPAFDAAALLPSTSLADPDMRPVYVRPPVFVPPST